MAFWCTATSWAGGPQLSDPDTEEETRSRFWERENQPASKEYTELIASGLKSISSRHRSRAAGIKLLLQAASLEPENPIAYWHLGNLCKTLSERDQMDEKSLSDATTCKERLLTVFKLDPDFSPSLLSDIANLSIVSFDFATALDFTHRVLAQADVDERAWKVKLGQILMALGHLHNALSVLEQAKAVVSDPALGVVLAIANERGSNPSEMTKYLKAVVKRDPSLRFLKSNRRLFIPRADYYYGLALGYLQIDEPAYALVNLKKYIEYSRNSPWKSLAIEKRRSLSNLRPSDTAVFSGSWYKSNRYLEKLKTFDRPLISCAKSVPNALFKIETRFTGSQKNKSPPNNTIREIEAGPHSTKELAIARTCILSHLKKLPPPRARTQKKNSGYWNRLTFYLTAP